MILNHQSTPISAYDSVRKSFTRLDGTVRTMSSTQDEKLPPFNRILAMKERFHIIEQRVKRHRVFAKPAFARGGGGYQELTPISGIRRAPGTVCVLGLLTQPYPGRFFLEDGSHSVELDMTEATSTAGLYTGNKNIWSILMMMKRVAVFVAVAYMFVCVTVKRGSIF
jgi:hypothetical protein